MRSFDIFCPLLRSFPYFSIDDFKNYKDVVNTRLLRASTCFFRVDSVGFGFIVGLEPDYYAPFPLRHACITPCKSLTIRLLSETLLQRTSHLQIVKQMHRLTLNSKIKPICFFRASYLVHRKNAGVRLVEAQKFLTRAIQEDTLVQELYGGESFYDILGVVSMSPVVILLQLRKTSSAVNKLKKGCYYFLIILLNCSLLTLRNETSNVPTTAS
jgi:hypothetical protein